MQRHSNHDFVMQAHLHLLCKQRRERPHIANALHLHSLADCHAQQDATDKVEIAAQQNHNIVTFGPGFLPPSLWPAGTLPNRNNFNALLINGHDFQFPVELVRSNRNTNNWTPGDCECQEWEYRSFGCHHVFHVQAGVKCGVAGMHGPDPVAVACYGKSKRTIEAKQLVLAPCSVLSCTWWAEQKSTLKIGQQKHMGWMYCGFRWLLFDFWCLHFARKHYLIVYLHWQSARRPILQL